MKKLLVLLTVLAFASSASATFTMVAPAELNGDTAALGVDVVGEKALVAQALVITGSALVTVDSSGVSIVELGKGEFVVELAGDPDMEAYLGGLGLSDIVSAMYYEAIDISANPMMIPDGALISGATITGIGEGIAGAHLVDMSAGSILASQDINVIPEPMTIALLGLGGLFLRRRK